MDYTASISDASPNYNDPTTFFMTVQFLDSNGSDVHNKQYCVPIANTTDENQALIQADIDSFSASYEAANAAVSNFNAVQSNVISVADALTDTVAEDVATDESLSSDSSSTLAQSLS